MERRRLEPPYGPHRLKKTSNDPVLATTVLNLSENCPEWFDKLSDEPESGVERRYNVQLRFSDSFLA